eukprot:4249900-Amphidinium_carterae.2
MTHETETRQRCRRWLEGERSSLWGVHRLRRKTASTRESTDPFLQRLERVQALVKEGLYQKAAAALHPGSIAEMSDQLVAEMKAKHPDARPEDEGARATLRSIHHTAALQGKIEDTLNAVQSFPKGFAGYRDEVIRQLTGATQLLLSGQVPAVCRPRLAGANLVALTKPQGGHRPIAVGEVLRSVAGKVAASSVREELQEVFQPIQQGVGASGGAERMIHLTRHAMDAAGLGS